MRVPLNVHGNVNLVHKVVRFLWNFLQVYFVSIFNCQENWGGDSKPPRETPPSTCLVPKNVLKSDLLVPPGLS